MNKSNQSFLFIFWMFSQNIINTISMFRRNMTDECEMSQVPIISFWIVTNDEIHKQITWNLFVDDRYVSIAPQKMVSKSKGGHQIIFTKWKIGIWPNRFVSLFFVIEGNQIFLCYIEIVNSVRSQKPKTNPTKTLRKNQRWKIQLDQVIILNRWT